MDQYIEIPGRLGAGKKDRVFKLNVKDIDTIAENPGMLCIWMKDGKEVRTDLSFKEVMKIINEAKSLSK